MSEIKYLDPEQANSIPGIKQQFRFVKKALEDGQTIPDIDQIRENANKGATAYQKPEDGIPASDLDSQVRSALAKAEDAVSVPGEPGTVGQVLQLDAQGNPAWVTPSAGTTPDSEMSSSSTNAVQNKVITEELNKYAKKDGSTSYVINQKEKSDGTYRDPSEMIVDHTPSKDNETKISLYGDLVYSDTIRRIRENSHIFVGRYDFTNNLLKARQVSDTDKTKWSSNNSTIVLSDEDDVFMRPPKFWWKCIKCDDDIYRIKFSMLQENIDETWFEWSGNTFIGVYEGFINVTGEEGSEIKTLRSRPGVTPTVNESWTTFTAAARARYGNNNGRCVTYEAHQIMALLGYGWAGTTDLQSLIGKGTSSYPKITGLCDNKGMIDSIASSNGNSTSINFWGLENWWGDIYEWLDNIRTAGNNNVNILGDDRTTISRTVITELQGNDGEIKKMVLGDNADLIPKLIISNSNYNKAYSDCGRVDGSIGYVALRSGSAASLAGGSGYFYANAGAGNVSPHFGSRLLYKGNYSIVNNLD